MNTGIGDAVNLAWKLAAVLEGRAPDSLLDTFEGERIGFARRLVATTDRVFSVATAPGRLADLVRTRLVPIVAPAALHVQTVREYLFRTVSQITLNYRGGALSQGAAGQVHGGDRLPWAPSPEADNFAPLSSIGWQVHVYGTATETLSAWCAAHGLVLHVLEWAPDHEAAGLSRDAAYLLRPDTYVALADPSGRPAVLERYFDDHSIRLPKA